MAIIPLSAGLRFPQTPKLAISFHKAPYRNSPAGGYSVRMLVETLFSPLTLLWLIGSALAVAILITAINRRRVRLVQALREHVDRQRQAGDTRPSEHSTTRDP